MEQTAVINIHINIDKAKGNLYHCAMSVDGDVKPVEDDVEFPLGTVDLLQHIILSHHGVHEYGSPKLPAIPEAFFIHYLDNLDAKMYMTTSAIENDPDTKATFTTFLRQLDTQVYKLRGEQD